MRRRIRVVVLALDSTLAEVALPTLAAAVALEAGRETVEVLSSNLVVSSSARDAVSGRVVAIDAGHGGPDSGAKGKSGLIEKHVNLHIALELQKFLGRSAVHTVMTRTDDTDLIGDGERVSGSRKLEDLRRRAALVNQANPDVFITIHSNSFPEPQWSGAQVFYNPGSDQGRLLAVHIQTKLVELLGPNTRKARPADIYPPHAAKAPAALVEVGFLSNPREERLLADASYRVRVAEAIYQGLVAYFMETATQADAGQTWGTVQRVSAEAAAGQDSVVLYFGGPTNLDGSLMPETRQIPGLTAMAPAKAVDAVLAALISGPGKDSILHPTIPSGTVVRSIRIEGEVAVLDFSAEFITNHWGGSSAEEMTVYSIVNTLTELPFVRAVTILVEGKPIGALTGHLALEGPLRRNTSMVRYRS